MPLDPASLRVTCVACGRTHELDRAGEIGNSPVERYRTAQSFAETHGVDLASAYSILLGLMSLDDAVKLDEPMDDCAAKIDEDRPSWQVSRPETGQAPLTYDGSFQDAVAGGYLSIGMAMQRGDRVTFASRVARRHGLPMSVAFDVADNRISLTEAIARKKTREAERTGLDRKVDRETGRRRRPWRAAAVLVVATGILAAVGWTILSDQDLPSNLDATDSRRQPAIQDAPTVEPITLIRTDEKGRLTQLIGPSPVWVLNAFCTSDAAGTGREPVRAEPSTDGWLGIFREGNRTFSIPIHKHEFTGSWVAGNGSESISSTRAAL